MTLSLIVGPPNSGRTGAILDAFRACLARDPVLVVPTVDDAERFEEELTGGGAAVLGATVCTFGRLFEIVAQATDAEVGPVLSDVQRRRVAREAVVRTPGLRLLADSSKRAGFASALDELIADLQASLVDPATLRERAAEAGPYEVEIASLYSSYCEVRDELGRADTHSLAAAATAALRTRRQGWGERPVLLYGFDDLTVEQLEMVRELWAGSQVTIALPWEDREILTAARGGLYAQLRDVEGVSIERLEPQPEYTRSKTLFELERRFGEERAPDAEGIANDGGLAMLASAGELAEVEAVAGEIAGLLDEGVAAGQIAVVLRSPETLGPLFRRVLERFGVPVAVQADMDVTRTLTGTGLTALLEAAVGDGGAEELLAYLRTPGIVAPSRVDWFERRIRRGRLRSADEALEAWAGGDRRDLVEVERLRAAASGPKLLAEAARQARWIAESAQHHGGDVAASDRALELRAGAELDRRLRELADLGMEMEPSEVIGAIAELTVPLWRGPTEGRVRVMSAYRARARRVEEMFICSLQDGDFPRRDIGGPLLSDDARAGLALLPRKRAEIEDRYLFASSLSRPTTRLWLSWRLADDEGGAAARSPFVDKVRELLDPPLPADLGLRDEMLADEAGGRGLAQSVFAPGDAPSRDELARSLAALVSGSAAAPPEPAELDEPDRIAIRARLDGAAARTTEDRRRPGPLQVAPVLAAMEDRHLFGPSTIEEYAECSYRWFVDKELKPRRIDPEDESLTAGQVAHKVLERVYGDRPGDTARPTPKTLGRWIERAGELTAEVGSKELPPSRPDTAATLRRVEGLVGAFLADEAAAPVAFTPDPALAEASFGFDDSEKGAYEIGPGASIHGMIDRIDRGPANEALVQDYKSGAKVDGGAGMLERGKLQLQLYLLAVRELWGLELAGGLYRPLGGTSKRGPKGLLRAELKDELAPLDPRPKDHLADEDFEAALEAARDRAAEIAASIRAGRIDRDPLGGACPRYCDFQPICRKERGIPEEDPDNPEDSEQ